jgi:ABC-type branched-subunit amino acid transport system ATPase component
MLQTRDECGAGAKLTEVLYELADAGTTLVLIEHNLEIIETTHVVGCVLNLWTHSSDGSDRFCPT